MATLLRMPGVSADADEAALESWAIAAGDQVKKGDPVASVETEKAVVDVEIDRDGTVHTLLVPAGAMVAVGDPIAVVLAPGEGEDAALALLAELGVGAGAAPAGAPSPAAEQPAPAAPAHAPVAEPVPTRTSAAVAGAPVTLPAGTAASNGHAGRVFASPLARRLALEHGLDVAALTGSGPHGRVVRDDVLAAAAARAAGPVVPTPAPAPEQATAPPQPSVPQAGPAAPVAVTGEAVPHTKVRQAIARRLQESKRTAPHFYLTSTLRVDALLALRAELNAAQPIRITVNDLVVKAAARALLDVPDMNVIWTDEAVVRAAHADVAVAMATDRGLMTPVVRSVETLSVSALSAAVKDLAARAAAGRLKQDELEGGTLSVTNLGMFGVDEFAAILNPPQAGILAVGAARKVPVVGPDDELTVGTVMTVTLSVDHRPVDGVVAATWLARFRELVEHPLGILV